MKNRFNTILGMVLILAGVIFLLKNLHIFDPILSFISINTFWPLLFVIFPGLIFHYAFFSGSKRDPGLLVPGGILLVTGLTLQLSVFTEAWDILWPLYIFAVAFGLFELYAFGNRDKGLLIPIGILGALSLIFFCSFSVSKILGQGSEKLVTPLAFVLLGLIVIFAGRKKKNY